MVRVRPNIVLHKDNTPAYKGLKSKAAKERLRIYDIDRLANSPDLILIKTV